MRHLNDLSMFTFEMNFRLLSLDGTQLILVFNSKKKKEFKALHWSSLWIDVDDGGSGRLMWSVAEVTAYTGQFSVNDLQ